MKKVIFKYILDVVDVQEIYFPTGAHILSIQTQHGKPCIWALVDPLEKGSQKRKFLVIGTGNETELIGNELFIGTFQLMNGNFVGHCFETDL